MSVPLYRPWRSRTLLSNRSGSWVELHTLGAERTAATGQNHHPFHEYSQPFETLVDLKSEIWP